jgi:branched-subunit amino acid transport protein AzlD
VLGLLYALASRREGAAGRGAVAGAAAGTALAALFFGLTVLPGESAAHVAGVLRLRDGPIEDDAVYFAETQYQILTVTADPDRPSHRHFYQDKLRHSEIDLAHPENLQYPYHRLYEGYVNNARGANADPIRLLCLGGGGYAYPQHLFATRPGSEIIAVEIDPGVPRAARAMCCAGGIAARSAAQGASFFLLYVLYLGDRRRYAPGRQGGRLTIRMLHIAMPLALSAYARTSLNTLQHILVPKGLRRAGQTADSAMADYGVIHGMAFPVVTFPACFLMALSELLVPELTEAQVAGRDDHIRRLTSALLERCLIFSAGVAAVLFTFSRELGLLIYSSESAGRFIGLLALLVPVMYMDMVTDGCLKGLGQMLYSMTVNIFDSLTCVILVLVLLPRYGLWGYVCIVFASELFNFALSFYRLRRMVHLRVDWGRCALSALCALGATQGVRLVLNLRGVRSSPLPGACLAIICSLGAYLLLLHALGALETKKDRS